MTRLAFTSDLHTDAHAANRQVWQEMVAMLQDIQPDVFICCGDIAAEPRQFGLTLLALEPLTCPKLLVPGNHDVWIQNGHWIRRGITSQQKYYQLLPALCREAGFHPLWLEPYVLGNIAFCGSMGWYDYSLRNGAFDGYVSRQDYGRKCFRGYQWNDGRFVHWYLQPDAGTQRQMSDEALTAQMVNEFTHQLLQAQQVASRIIAVTHMLPFRAMMAYSQKAQRDYFSAFMGSVVFGAVLQACPAVERVLSGHTHRQLTVRVGRITAHTSPLGYVGQWQESTPLAMARQRLSLLDLV